jgi:hypothetical protein
MDVSEAKGLRALRRRTRNGRSFWLNKMLDAVALRLLLSKKR